METSQDIYPYEFQGIPASKIRKCMNLLKKMYEDGQCREIYSRLHKFFEEFPDLSPRKLSKSKHLFQKMYADPQCRELYLKLREIFTLSSMIGQLEEILEKRES